MVSPSPSVEQVEFLSDARVSRLMPLPCTRLCRLGYRQHVGPFGDNRDSRKKFTAYPCSFSILNHLVLFLFLATFSITLKIVFLVPQEGIGGLQIVRGGMIASGEVHVMERLVAARISTPPHVPVRILAAENFSISATDKKGRTSRIIMSECLFGE